MDVRQRRIGAIVIYDVNSPSSFASVPAWVNRIRGLFAEEDETNRPSILLIGNKTDLRGRRSGTNTQGGMATQSVTNAQGSGVTTRSVTDAHGSGMATRSVTNAQGRGVTNQSVTYNELLDMAEELNIPHFMECQASNGGANEAFRSLVNGLTPFPV